MSLTPPAIELCLRHEPWTELAAVCTDPNHNAYASFADALSAFFAAVCRVEVALAPEDTSSSTEENGASVEVSPVAHSTASIARDVATGFRFLAVPVGSQGDPATVAAVKAAIPRFCGLPVDGEAAPLPHVVQVVGGMVPLLRPAQQAAMDALNSVVRRSSARTRRSVVVNHGYSGYLFNAHPAAAFPGDIVDVNTLLAKAAVQSPGVLLLPNLVNNHAESHHHADPARPLGGPVVCPRALLVYDPARPMRDARGACTLRYGRDMPLTDALCDTLVMFGGGIQSLAQMVAVLQRGGEVDLVMAAAAAPSGDRGYASLSVLDLARAAVQQPGVPLGLLLEQLCAPSWELAALLADDAYVLARERYPTHVAPHMAPEAVRALQAEVEAAMATQGLAAQVRARYAGVQTLLGHGGAQGGAAVCLAFDPCKEDAPTKAALLQSILPQLNSPAFRRTFDKGVTVHDA